jgi:hypothetical protein
MVQQITAPLAVHAEATSDIIDVAKPSLKDITKQGYKRPTYKESSTVKNRRGRLKSLEDALFLKKVK